MFISGRDLSQAMEVKPEAYQLLAWNTAVHQLLNISFFSFPVPPAVAKYIMVLLRNKIFRPGKGGRIVSYFVLSILRRFKGHVSLQEYIEQGRVLQ